MLSYRAEHAETLDDLVGHELRVGVTGLAVVAVVVALSTLDVVGQCGWDDAVVAAVALHNVRDVVANHATEPAHLIPLVCEVVAHIRGRGHADFERLIAATRLIASRSGGLDGPLHDEGIGELQDQSVRL